MVSKQIIYDSTLHIICYTFKVSSTIKHKKINKNQPTMHCMTHDIYLI